MSSRPTVLTPLSSRHTPALTRPTHSNPRIPRILILLSASTHTSQGFLAANYEHRVWPETSLSFGLGISYMAFADRVKCWDRCAPTPHHTAPSRARTHAHTHPIRRCSTATREDAPPHIALLLLTGARMNVPPSLIRRSLVDEKFREGLGYVTVADFQANDLEPSEYLDGAIVLHWSGRNKPWAADAPRRLEPEMSGPFERARRALGLTDGGGGGGGGGGTTTALASGDGGGTQQVTKALLYTEPRSGSEWFMEQLDAHPDVCASGTATKYAACSAARPLSR